jgi:CopG family transcriptional regulator, nickel-responsive regulator
MGMDGHGQRRHRRISRISVSLPEGLHNELDRMVEQRGFVSRSQAVGEVLQQFLLEHKRERGEDVMVGTMTLVYDHSVRGLQGELADLQRRYLDEVIGSLHVQLMHDQTMEVILVQGPVRTLERLSDAMTGKRGVICGKLHLIAALMPQLHPFIRGPASSAALPPQGVPSVPAHSRRAR